MAEFCYVCSKKILRGKKSQYDLLISKDLDLCEGCGEYKQVVIRYKSFIEILIYKLLK